MIIYEIAKQKPVHSSRISSELAISVLKDACKKIAPAWPLESLVAVNPYLGLSDRSFEASAFELAAAAGIQMTLPLSFYKSKLKNGEINLEHIEVGLKRQKGPWISASELLEDVIPFTDEAEPSSKVPSVAKIAGSFTGKDWNRFVISRISSWASSYFDKGQAIWSSTDENASLFESWKADAAVDLHPEIMGLKRHKAFIRSLPDDPLLAAQKALFKIGMPEELLPIYLHHLLLNVGGWAAFIARLDFESKLYEEQEGKLPELLAILLCWEASLLHSLDYPDLEIHWVNVLSNLSTTDATGQTDLVLKAKLILQEAFDLSMQSKLIHKLEKVKKQGAEEPVTAQAIFCIDVRSELFRRNLELADNSIATLGFAGFFAFPIKYVPLAQVEGVAQCPVLLKTGPVIKEEIPEKDVHEKAVSTRKQAFQLNQLWKGFKSGAISCFSFVSPLGLFYLPKLFTDSFNLTRPVPHPTQAGLPTALAKKSRLSLKHEIIGGLSTGMTIAQQVELAKNALKAMSLTENFANLVLIVGHGSSSVNNPHASGLDCGACGGHSGEANSKIAAEVLNSKIVREQLHLEGISIPTQTIFLACLHNTTTDEVEIFNEYAVPEDRYRELQNLKKSLVLAGKTSRAERALRMSINSSKNIDSAIVARSKDWSQIRPEWGLAGCAAFIVAPRSRTKGIDLEGKAFLHSYEWEKDQNFSVLELIMTAPMVVTSWINLQYYGSTVDNKHFGAGNKTLHNVTGGIGVLEGSSGDLRIGLPWQSVHDGKNYQHEPLRLSVIIEAPIEAMNQVLKKHQAVRHLCDNGWLYLLAMNSEGKVSHRYAGKLTWEEVKE